MAGIEDLWQDKNNSSGGTIGRIEIGSAKFAAKQELLESRGLESEIKTTHCL